MKYNIKDFLQKIVEPKSKDDNLARQEYILNILTTGIIFLISMGMIIATYNFIFFSLENYKNNSLSLFFIFIILLFFVVIYFLSRRGYSRLASYIFLSIIFILATYMGCTWGIDLQAEILFYVLLIVTAGIITGAKSAFISTFLISLTLLIVYYLQKINLIPVNRMWTTQGWKYSDIIMISTILFIIAAVSWLFNKELKKSEANLKTEKDLLEVRVEEKTKELKIIQAEEIAQVYRFAEFGRLSSGLFHDLVNPLTTVMLNVDKMKLDGENQPSLNFIKLELEQVSKASEKMKQFINSVRKQISPQGKKIFFCLNQEIEDAISVLNYKANKDQVCLLFTADEKMIISGDSIKFNQIVTNLISNAIDSYNNCESNNKKIKISLKKNEKFIILSVTDNGCGIKNTIIDKIFEPFFTTKIDGNNLGLGLSLIKKIIEEDFLGNIKVLSYPNKGTTFIVNLPLN